MNHGCFGILIENLGEIQLYNDFSKISRLQEKTNDRNGNYDLIRYSINKFP